MQTVQLRPELVDEIRHFAGAESLGAELFVEKALRVYMNQLRKEKIQSEGQAFDKQLPELLTRYADQYVAMHEGRVVDSDANLRQLHLRMFAQFGHTPILLRQVTERPPREIVFRSPRLETK